VHKRISTLCLIIAFGFTLNGCSSMSPQARRQQAYRNYVQKQMKQRQKALAKAQKAANRQAKRQMKEQLKLAQPSEPRITSGVESVPGSWSEPTSEQIAAPSASDQNVPPVTASAANEIMATQNPDQPSPP
jgi:hypothetical protein